MMTRLLFRPMLFVMSLSSFNLYGAQANVAGDVVNVYGKDKSAFLSQVQDGISSGWKSVKDQFSPPELEKLAKEVSHLSNRCYGFEKLNFGVVVNNSKFQIYRSRALGHKGVTQLFNHLLDRQLPLPKMVIFTNKDGFKKSGVPFLHKVRAFDNFAVQEAKIFGEQPGVPHPEIAFYHPLNAPVYLPGQDLVHEEEHYTLEQVADKHTREFFSQHVPKTTRPPEIIHGEKNNLFFILNLILHAKGPTLFHCTGGLHRTGMLALAIRYLQGGKWTEPFSKSIYVKVPGGKILKELELRNLAEVEYYLHNKLRPRQKNLAAIRNLSHSDPYFHALRERFRADLILPSTCQ